MQTARTVHLIPPDAAIKRLCFDGTSQNLRPNMVLVDRQGAVVFEINELGLKGASRDPSRKLAVIWGDSVVFGVRWSWPCLMDELAPGYQFLNGGIEGDPYTNILRRASEFNQERAVELNLLMLGWHPLPDNRNVRTALTDFVEKTRNTVLFTMPTALNRRIADLDLSSYLTSRDAEDAFTFCGDLPYSRKNQSIGFNYIVERNEIIRETASEMNIRVVDLFAEFDTEKLDDFRQDFNDMIHLRASAHPKIVRAVYEGIKDLLRPASPLPIDTDLG